MRIMLFTDTLGDVNGVCRFVENVSREALVLGGLFRDQRLAVVTSTRFPVPDRANILNLRPVCSVPMPGYAPLHLVVPPLGRLCRAFDDFKPDVVHISTPGPVGLAGLALARRACVPVVGVFHTDFPAYVDRLFDDEALTRVTAVAMSMIYRRFACVLTRSADYGRRLVDLGVEPARLETLRTGLDLSGFSPRFRDPSIWTALGVPASTVKFLYVGRVSLEKNLPFLVSVWKSLNARGSLVVVGDGPYREAMERELAGTGAHFLGFRRGAELSALYASSDAFVFPSITDTLGQVVLEAQASGLPVIVSDRGGPKEVVRDSITGHILSTQSPANWALCLREALNNRAHWREMGTAAAGWAQTYPIRGCLEHFLDVHRRACGACSDEHTAPRRR